MGGGLVSVIVPVYNAAGTIRTTIESILCQTYENFELLIVDDGSTDCSIDVCRSLNSEKIIIIEQKNAGPAVARNVGLEHANGKYVCFIDADDKVKHDYIEKLVDAIVGTQMGICGYNIVEKNKITTFSTDTSILRREEAHIAVLSERAINGYLWNKIFLKEIIDANGISFEDKIYVGEDLVFVQMYLTFCSKIRVIEEVLYNYFYMQESISHRITVKNLSLLKAYEKIWFISASKKYRNIVLNKFIGHWLTYLEVLKDCDAVIEYINEFKDRIQISEKEILANLIKKYKFKYLLYLFDRRIYLLFMRVYRKFFWGKKD